MPAYFGAVCELCGWTIDGCSSVEQVEHYLFRHLEEVHDKKPASRTEEDGSRTEFS